MYALIANPRRPRELAHRALPLLRVDEVAAAPLHRVGPVLAPGDDGLAPEAARETEPSDQVGDEGHAAAFGDVPEEVERSISIGRHQRFIFIGRRGDQRDEQPARRAHRWGNQCVCIHPVGTAPMLPWTASNGAAVCGKYPQASLAQNDDRFASCVAPALQNLLDLGS